MTTEYSTSLFQKAVILLASIGEYDDESLLPQIMIGQGYSSNGLKGVLNLPLRASGLDIVNQLQFCQSLNFSPNCSDHNETFLVFGVSRGVPTDPN